MKKLLAALFTSILLSIAWPANGSLTPLVFIGFVPMLWLENEIRTSNQRKKGRSVFLYAWLAFGLFNLLTTWWVAYAHWSGTVATTLVNGGLMAFCFWLFHKVSVQIGANRGLLVFPFLWMLVEYLHMDWDMSFPWLNMGYALANRVTWIQWYSYVGTWGGSLWILWVNAIIFYCLRAYSGKARFHALAIYALPFIVLPIVISVIMYSNYEENGQPVNVVVVQPNIDPYTEKFEISDAQATERFIELAEPFLTEETDYLIGPETMVGRGLDEEDLRHHRGLGFIQFLGDSFPNLHTVIGATTYRRYPTKATATARESSSGTGFYDAYNSALQITNSTDPIAVYHKSKLVVGVEKVPFQWILGPLLKGIDLGGATGTLGGQADREVFFRKDSTGLGVGVPVCWEADFPGYTAEFVANGAQLLFAITNDGWWANTPGKDQHLHYARVRAIENRRSIARSANTGISCVINQRGDVSHVIPYEERGAFSATIYTNDELSVFSKTGDFIGRVSVFISIAVLLSVFVKIRTADKSKS